MESDTERQDAFDGNVFRSSIGIAMALADPQGRFLDCNAAWSAMLGYWQANLQALDITALSLPEVRSENDAMHDRLRRREAPNCIVEKRYLARAGETIWCEMHMALA